MSLAEKKELRCKIDTCIWYGKYIWYNKKTNFAERKSLTDVRYSNDLGVCKLRQNKTCNVLHQYGPKKQFVILFSSFLS